MKILKKIGPKINLKLRSIFEKMVPFFDKSNVKITKKYIILNLIFSPLLMLCFVNIVYLAKIFFLYLATTRPVPLETHVIMFAPFISFIVAISIYGILTYITKSLFISFVGSTFVKFLNVGISILFISFAFQATNPSIFMILLLVNIIAIMFAFINNRKYDEHTHDFKNIAKFKLVLVDIDGFKRIVTFLNNMQIFYHSGYIIVNRYKLSYQDISVFENQFNKKLYDFNQDEINVVKMYALN